MGETSHVSPPVNISDIFQGDGNDSITSIISNSTHDSCSNQTLYHTDDEVDSAPDPVNLLPVPGQALHPTQPVQLDVVTRVEPQHSAFLPLCIMLNARSVFNKSQHLKDLYQLGPDVLLISETFEKENKQLSNIIGTENYEILSYYRKGGRLGGGCAIVFNQARFKVEKANIEAPEEVEAVWAVLTPRADTRCSKVKRIAVGSIYVSPNSRFKVATIDHIIETIHLLRSKYNNEVHFLCGGDVNRLNISSILDAYGALKQCVTVPTRKTAILEVVLSDLSNMYHSPTTLPPLQVDNDKTGSDSDHNIVVFAPQLNTQYKTVRKKKTMKVRPLPESAILKYETELIKCDWENIINCKDVNEKVTNFHETIISKLDKYLPEKTVRISSLDKKWMLPKLKALHRQLQREYYKNRRSIKWKQLKIRFKREKRKAVKTFYASFVSDLKRTDPKRWFGMAKRIGALDRCNDDISVESLEGLNNKQCAQEIASHYAKISSEFLAVNTTELPCYLPAEQPPQVEEHEVFARLKALKRTRSTLPIDLPDKIRQACAVELTTPLTDIINASLTQAIYPELWQQEWVTPAPKVTDPKEIKDLRKISSTSDFSKLFEGFLKDWIIEDIHDKLDIAQYGGRKGIGTEHMIVNLLDRILKLLDRHPNKSAVIAASLDWAAAFDRQDPTTAIKKFIALGVRPSLVPLLVSYLSKRKMKVRFNGEESEFFDLVGGGPQGTLLGQLEYLVLSNDNADCVSEEDRFKYIDESSSLMI